MRRIIQEQVVRGSWSVATSLQPDRVLRWPKSIYGLPIFRVLVGETCAPALVPMPFQTARNRKSEEYEKA